MSLDVEPPADLWVKEHRSYFIWEYGKAPDLVLEIVSNRKGGELKDKLLDYACAGVGYYVVFDPWLHLKQGTLRIFGRQANGFSEYRETWLPGLGLGVKFWEGEYEGCGRPGCAGVTGKVRSCQQAARWLPWRNSMRLKPKVPQIRNGSGRRGTAAG